jgi:hypothetical protein
MINKRRFKSLLLAAKDMDWMQIVMHQGVPCFHLCADGRFCGRAQQWPGHEDLHEFISLEDLLTSLEP